MGVMNGVINVKDSPFGARGDDSTNDRNAIQAAINEAANPANPDGATIFFPHGRYVVKGAPLILPRLPSFRTVVFKGVGWMASTIYRGDTTSAPEPGFEPVLIKADPDLANGHIGIGYVFEDLELAGGEETILKWDIQIPAFGDDPANPRDPGRRLEAFFQRVVFRGSSAGQVAPLVFIRGGSRCRFLHCLFYGANRPGGVSVKLLNCGGTTLIDCHTIFLAGALLDVEGGGELVVLNSRSEGGIGRPAWKFVDSGNITLINPANEGESEDPSVFLFERCSQVLLINPQIATGDTSPYPDGIRFVECENCRIIGGGTGKGTSFSVNGARLIRVDANSKYIVGEGIQTDSNPAENDFDIQGEQCCFEIWGSQADIRRVIKVGDCPTPADYLVITRASFLLQLGAVALPARPEMSFTFKLPKGAILDRSEPLLHYKIVGLQTPGAGNQMGIAVEINGAEVHRELFREGSQDVFVEAILGGVHFALNGTNTIKFRPVSPTNNQNHTITFSNVVLWFQR